VNPLLVHAAIDFFGVDHVLFGSDTPMDAHGGHHFASAAADSINRLPLTQTDRDRLYGNNLRRIAHLSE
jgi:aminocarboxymuconate-semialdehyde decarboxylase